MNKSQQIIALTEEMGIDEGFVSNLTSALSSGVKSATGAVSGGVKKIKQAELGKKVGGLAKKTGQGFGTAFQGVKKAAKGANTALPRVKPGGGLRLKTALIGGQAMKKAGSVLRQKKQNIQNKIKDFKSRVPTGREAELKADIKSIPGAIMKRGKERLQKLDQRPQGSSKAGLVLRKNLQGVKDRQKLAGQAVKGHGQRIANYMARQKDPSVAPGKFIKGRKAIGNTVGDIAQNVRMGRRYTKRQHRKDQQAYMQARSDHEQAAYGTGGG